MACAGAFHESKINRTPVAPFTLPELVWKRHLPKEKRMKKNLMLSLAFIFLAGCATANRTPYNGKGEYGFTFDVPNSPSPFRDTSYRPLTVRDLAKPIIFARTNQVTLNLAGPDPVESSAETPPAPASP